MVAIPCPPWNRALALEIGPNAVFFGVYQRMTLIISIIGGYFRRFFPCIFEVIGTYAGNPLP
jgi:hypothetical protein